MQVQEFKEGMELSGYVVNMPEDYYHTTKGFISKSSLSMLKQSVFKFFNQPKRNPTKAMQIGTALHCAVLEPEKFKQAYIMMPEVKSKALKVYKEAVKDNPDSEIMTGSDCSNLDGMIAAIKGNKAASELLGLDGWCEVSGFHEDADTGVKLRHRFDKLTKCGIGIDLKKTQSVAPEEIAKTIQKYGYHMQDSLYSDGYEAITGFNLSAFYFIFVEEQYPHEVAVVYLDDVSKQVGRDEYKDSLGDYSFYSQNRDKVHNNSGIQMVSLPEWSLRQYENELEDGGII
ncbi:putative exodeoxyribonuclease 8 [Vibrio phage 1.144.O._10N.286.45.B3]|nr:putative exodeoxyribonuclease 8 [Vibrio phage 1.144.O._10N.286.45.B3]